ncbi:NAD(P)/FAD-dependent oxidoreductase [Sphingomonas crocodyli]|uniref:FAD-binding oxidoreductase n=1 Tax=Sphingomonas crocodyli TaxID=1979270 RepID=A0A437M715_9SPHN|nr:FAD-dependent oxidoreductase [Sphingomonas crocodyli]RVT93508.1 FAD-binding oxidoreductase [Sphingomonas crocodyli]
MTETADAIIIGGGLHGLSAALQLARRGLNVLLLERARIGRHSSGASAAGVRTLGRAPAELPISLAAMEMWHNIADLVGDDCGFQATGQLRVAETQAQLEQLSAQVTQHQLRGYTNEEIVGAAELRELAPTIAPHCLGGVFARRDGAADPHRTLAAFLRSARSAGVQIREGAGVTSLAKRGDIWLVAAGEDRFEAPLLVNAAGAWAGQIAAMAGDDIPIGTKASMMIVTERIAPMLKPTVSAVGRMLSFKQTLQGTILIGGGQQGRFDLVRESADVDARALAKSAAAAVALFPGVERLRIVRTWSGLEAATQDHIAIAGLSPSTSGLMHLFGFTGHGFQLVPALGIVTADMLLDGATCFDVAGLRPDRLMHGAARDPLLAKQA